MAAHLLERLTSYPISPEQIRRLAGRRAGEVMAMERKEAQKVLPGEAPWPEAEPEAATLEPDGGWVGHLQKPQGGRYP